jgi:hypothetical protein
VPRGGWRPNSGRKRGDPKKPPHDVVTENPDTLLPVEWMLAVLRDPLVEQRRRDEMAKQCAPYLHPRLAVTEARVVHRGAVTDENINVVQIFAVPRGGSLDINSGTITVDGAPSEPVSIKPFEPTKPLELPAPTADLDPNLPERLEVIEPVDDNKIESLSAWRRKPDEDPSVS